MDTVSARNKRCSPLTTQPLLVEGFGSSDGCSGVMVVVLCIISLLVGAAIGYAACKKMTPPC
jgi:hypothetical protein